MLSLKGNTAAVILCPQSQVAVKMRVGLEVNPRILTLTLKNCQSGFHQENPYRADETFRIFQCPPGCRFRNVLRRFIIADLPDIKSLMERLVPL